MSVQTNLQLQRGSGPGVLLHEGDNEGVNPEDVRLGHLYQLSIVCCLCTGSDTILGLSDAGGNKDPGARPVSNA